MFFGMNAWLLAALSVGALLQIAFVSAPFWRRTGGRAGVQALVFAMSRGAPVLAGAAGLAGALGLIAAATTWNPIWLLGSAAAFGAIAFTATVMRGVGDRLRAIASQEDNILDLEAGQALSEWERLNLLRSGVAVLALVFFTWAAH